MHDSLSKIKRYYIECIKERDQLQRLNDDLIKCSRVVIDKFNVAPVEVDAWLALCELSQAVHNSEKYKIN